jgi:hypothetical protein
VAEHYADQAITTRAGRRLPITRLLKRRFADRERLRRPSAVPRSEQPDAPSEEDADLKSAPVVALQLAFGFRPAWAAADYADEIDDRVSLEALLVDAVGIARHGVETTPTEQPLLVTDPSTLPGALDMVTKVGGIRGWFSALADGKHALTDAELALGKAVVYTFTGMRIQSEEPRNLLGAGRTSPRIYLRHF